MVGCGSTPSPAPSATSSAVGPSASAVSLATPTSTPAPTTRSTATPQSPVVAATASLPVNGSAREIGGQILIAPGPDGGLYVSIPRVRGSVLALLDRSGRPKPGWPMTIDKTTACDLLLPVDDGSVRVVCNGTDLPRFENDVSDVRAFAFWPDGVARWAGGRSESGLGTGGLVGNELTILAIQPLTDTVATGQISREHVSRPSAPTVSSGTARTSRWSKPAVWSSGRSDLTESRTGQQSTSVAASRRRRCHCSWR